MRYRRNYSDEAIVIGRRNYSEADRIVTFYSRHFGKLSLIAKGVRKLKSRKRGSLEIFSYIKFSGISKPGLDFLTETSLLESFPLIRKNLKKVSVAYFFCETVFWLTREGEKHEEIFKLLLSNLKRLVFEKKIRTLRLSFIKEILFLSGFWPKEKPILNPDLALEEIIERKMGSLKVGRRIFS